MEALRWILLLAGLVFIAILAAWELRRPRQGRGNERNARSEPELGGGLERAAPDGGAATGTASASRRVRLEPPLVQIPDEPGSGDASPPGDEASALDVESVDLPAIDPEAIDAAAGAQQGLAEASPESPPDAAPLIVEWPPEAERQILTLRVSAPSEERLGGRALRQALAGLGFLYGRFGIFHQPGSDGHALISAASLTAPGVFDLSSMDFQRFAGLSLFVVLPGPLPPAAALDHLHETACELAERLRAQVQDEQGETLDAPRLEALRTRVQGLPGGAAGAEPNA